MNTMTYKGYTARVEYDERDNIFAGRILGIRNIISFHGETVAELRAEFELAIKDYLADCKEQGLHPEKPASGKLLLRVTPEIHGFHGHPRQVTCSHVAPFDSMLRAQTLELGDQASLCRCVRRTKVHRKLHADPVIATS
jgi:predicted HicB family RNase H-like nuclease